MSNGRSEWARLGVSFATSLSKCAGISILCLAGCTGVWGQATASIHGIVRDTSGAVVAGATVKATHTGTGAARTTTAAPDGVYALTNLPLGPYQLEVSKEGFATYVQKDITLDVGSAPEINVALQVGAVSQRVEVTGAPNLVETQSASVGQLVEPERIVQLPLNGRQVTDLVTLSGAAVQTATAANYAMATGVNIEVAGGLSHSVQYNLDGASHLDYFIGTGMPLPFPDAMSEFRVKTGAQDAPSGGHTSATVDAVTKAGTNAFHGDVFEFVRNYAVNAHDFFASSNDGLKRNQFGGVVGGPILKDKLFFFAGYQGTILRQTPVASTEFVPTAAMQMGDFSACPDAAGLGNGAFGKGILSSPGHLQKFLLSPAAQAIAARLPQSSDPCGLVHTGNPAHQNDHQGIARLDYQTGKHYLFMRYLLTNDNTAVAYTLAPNDVLSTGAAGDANPIIGADDWAHSATIGDTWVISSGMINSFRVFGNHVITNHPGARFFGPSDVGISNLFTYVPKYFAITVAGAFNVGFPSQFSSNLNDSHSNFGVNDDVTLIRGAHQILFGGQVTRARLDSLANAFPPLMVFTPAATGFPLADFMIGNITFFRQETPNPENLTQNYFSLYAADTWKATSKLSLNYGVRWNPFFPMNFKSGKVYDFSLANFSAGVHSTKIPNAPAGFGYPGDPGFNGKSGMERHLAHFEPRIGIAWDPFGDGKTSVRAGAALAYDFMRMDIHQNTASAAPFGLTYINFFLHLDDPYNVSGGGTDPFPYNFDPKNPTYPTQFPFQTFFPIPPDLKTTVQYSWNFGIQRQITPSWFLSATYIGTQLAHTWTAVDLNPGQFIGSVCTGAPGQVEFGPPGTVNCSSSRNVNLRRLLFLQNPAAAGNIGDLFQLDASGTQSYHGLLVDSTLRLGKSFTLIGNYTLSHCIGLPVTQLTNGGNAYIHAPFQNNGPNDRHLDYGDCTAYSGVGGPASLDIRHIGNVTLVASTRRFSGDWARRLGTGWTFSSSFRILSGQPLTPALGQDVALNGFAGNVNTGVITIPQRPNLTGTSPVAPNQGQGCAGATSPCISWFNPAAYIPPAPTPGTYGNAGVGSVRGPGFWEWDQAISRAFQIREGQQLEVRAEAFNVTNTPQFANPDMNLSDPTFGQILSTVANNIGPNATSGGPRILQFAMKYVF